MLRAGSGSAEVRLGVDFLCTFLVVVIRDFSFSSFEDHEARDSAASAPPRVAVVPIASRNLISSRRRGRAAPVR
jgi:hypothetical protein